MAVPSNAKGPELVSWGRLAKYAMLGRSRDVVLHGEPWKLYKMIDRSADLCARNIKAPQRAARRQLWCPEAAPEAEMPLFVGSPVAGGSEWQ
jgi:hypothetical protein